MNPETGKLMEIHGTVRDILKNKGGEVWTTRPQNTVYEAIRLMGEKNIGALVVVDGDMVVGMLSERDYSRKIVLQGRASRDTLVDAILARPVITVQSTDNIEKCMQLMTSRRIRHLPVVDDGHLVGLVSIGDLVNWVMLSQR
ncbi:MAG: CBS domain-containing protein, partial [Verrucomicrobia bacterium]|nr:CBS domain-containing protein [Verrucomicrobiota bacterium]